MMNPDENIMQFALSFPVKVNKLAVKGLHLTLETDEQERRRIADNHGLLQVSSFFGEFHLSPWKKRGVRLKGKVVAEIVQSCVVTLEPITNSIDQSIEVLFVPDDSRLVKKTGRDEGHELFLDADGPDAPEVFEGDTIDVGAVAEEFFELALDPYPRKKGVEAVEFQEVNNDKQDNQERVSPFAILQNLKQT